MEENKPRALSLKMQSRRDSLRGFSAKQIAYRILTTHNRDSPRDKFSFSSSEDKEKAITWLSTAITSVFNLSKYNLLGAERNELDRFISRSLTDTSSPLHNDKFFKEFPVYYTGVLKYRFGCLSYYIHYTISCRNMDDERAIEMLKELVAHAFISSLLSRDPRYEGLLRYYNSYRTALTLACIRKFRPHSFFAQLPKDVVNIILSKLRADNDTGHPFRLK